VQEEGIGRSATKRRQGDPRYRRALSVGVTPQTNGAECRMTQRRTQQVVGEVQKDPKLQRLHYIVRIPLCSSILYRYLVAALKQMGTKFYLQRSVLEELGTSQNNRI